MNKKEIRAIMLKKRAGLSDKEKRASSEVICKKISRMDSFIKARNVLFYYPIKNEVDILPLLESEAKDKTISFPCVGKTDGDMTARKVMDINLLVKGSYGIPEPSKNAGIVWPEEIDFVIIPLVAFDKDNNRLGYGGGYYDRYLPKCKNAVKCGVAFSFQETEQLDSDIHDIALDMVVTEHNDN